MPKRPENFYQIYDPTDTSDLVIWTPLNRAPDYMESRAKRRRVTECLPEANCLAGPIESQYDFDPLNDDTVELPVHYHFRLDSQKQQIHFLYITNTTIELHLPELWFVTGKPLEDDSRLKIVRSLTRKLSEALGIEWELAEYDGRDTDFLEGDIFWETYLNNLFARIDYEELNE